MIAVDTNLLIYAHRADSPWHQAAAQALRELVDEGATWAIPWPCVHEFLAIVTHPRKFRVPTPLLRATQQIEDWSESPSLRFIGENSGYWDLLKSTLHTNHILGAKIHDARIAAICLGNGVRVLWSADRDFSRIPGLRVVNPVAGKA